MRRLAITTATTALVLAASATFATPADAMRERGPATSARGGLKCPIGVVGFDSGHHIRSDDFTNGRLEQSRTSAKTLPFDVTAFGYFDSSGTSKRNRLRLNVVASDGIPRNVTLKRTRHSVKIGKVKKYQDRSFTPRLYADGGTFYAYVLNGGTLKRWSLSRYPNGDVRYAQPAKVRGRLGDLTSLQAASYTEVHGVASEILYATNSGGQLLQIVVPLKHPSKARVHKLAASGYEGVTELSWSLCNNKGDYHTLIAIDPVGNRATWTTIKHAFTRPKSKLQGAVTGVSDWNLSAGF